jgi:PAS domain S-box-containing protein
MLSAIELLRAIPAAIYVTDAEGRITFFNDAAAELWGQRPETGSARWSGAWRLHFPDGRPMRHDESPMAMTLRERAKSQGGAQGHEVIVERPNGARVPVRQYPNLLEDDQGHVSGGISLLIDVGERRRAEVDTARLAAIVASSEDAIVSKTLEGLVTSWNGGAERIFGYAPTEMIGQSIKKIIPPDRQAEEDEILAKLRRGERIEHFDTVRVGKDGREVEISVTISPIRDGTGAIVGASKVARDIGERRRHESMQRLLFDELNHRVKNTLATVQAIASQSMKTAASPRDFVAGFSGRVQALARAHDLLVQRKMRGATLRELLREQVALGATGDARITLSGPDVTLGPHIAIQLALLLHELATNARKYGALRTPTGKLSIRWSVGMQPERELVLSWRESRVTHLAAPGMTGFGMTLIERSLEANGGSASIHYAADGLRCEIRLPLPEVPAHPSPGDEPQGGARPGAGHDAVRRAGGAFHGRRVLLVEDEPLVALDVEAELTALGVEVIGPAGSLASAEQLIGNGRFDAALLDANLQGEPVDRLAAALAAREVPFAFATGYGREALPAAFRDRPMLAKPFDAAKIRAIVGELLEGGETENAVGTPDKRTP